MSAKTHTTTDQREWFHEFGWTGPLAALDSLVTALTQAEQERDEAHRRLSELHAAEADTDGRPWSLSERITHLKSIWYMRGYNAKSNDRIDDRARAEAAELRAQQAEAALLRHPAGIAGTPGDLNAQGLSAFAEACAMETARADAAAARADTLARTALRFWQKASEPNATPWDVDQDCRFCGQHFAHYDDCPWEELRAALSSTPEGDAE